MAKFHPPEAFDFTKPQNWPEWRQRWKRFHSATKMSAEPGEVQVSSLIYAMGQEAETIYSSFVFQEEAHANDHSRVLEKFDNHFVPTVNVIHERANFHRRLQQPGENVETYIRALYDLVITCGYEDGLKNEAIRDQLVVGISDKQTSERLQLKEDLTLNDAIEMCRTSELVKTQMALQAPAAALDTVKTKKYPLKQQQQRYHTNRSGWSKQSKCPNCALQHRNHYCPARNKRCMFCQLA